MLLEPDLMQEQLKPKHKLSFANYQKAGGILSPSNFSETNDFLETLYSKLDNDILTTDGNEQKVFKEQYRHECDRCQRNLGLNICSKFGEALYLYLNRYTKQPDKGGKTIIVSKRTIHSDQAVMAETLLLTGQLTGEFDLYIKYKQALANKPFSNLLG